MSVPSTRRLATVLRASIQAPRPGELRLVAGKVTGVVDTAHVSVELEGGVTVTVACLSGAAATTDAACYLLSTGTSFLYLGCVD